MNVWVIKCRLVKADGSRGWHWQRYFAPPVDERWEDWGGSDWIESTYSQKLLREDVSLGDLAICYQKDDPHLGRAILGFTVFDSDGKEDDPGSGVFNCFDLCAPRDAFCPQSRSQNTATSLPRLSSKVLRTGDTGYDLSRHTFRVRFNCENSLCHYTRRCRRTEALARSRDTANPSPFEPRPNNGDAREPR